jgi:hypothetical protein
MAVAYRYRCCNLSQNALRGSQISTPYNIDEVDLNGARFRSTSHNDAAVGFPAESGSRYLPCIGASRALS